MTELIGIVNVTRDSFSDGGLTLDPDAAVARGRELACAGATWVDVGGVSTHPDAEDVPEEEEIARVEPVVRALAGEGIQVSVDTYRPRVMERVLEAGAAMINDVTGLRSPGAAEAVRASGCRLIVMHSTATGPRAQRRPLAGDPLERIEAFFQRRLGELAAAGIDPERVIVDPGAGFFLSADPEPTLRVLAHIDRLRRLGRPLCVSVSRKSFLGAVTGRPPRERGAATLAAEIHLWRANVEFIRTHDVAALADAIAICRAIDGARS